MHLEEEALLKLLEADYDICEIEQCTEQVEGWDDWEEGEEFFLEVSLSAPIGATVEIFFMWEDGHYVLGYTELPGFLFEAKTPKKALRLFHKLVEDFYFYQRVFDDLYPQPKPHYFH